MDNRTIEEVRENETKLISEIKQSEEENQELKKQNQQYREVIDRARVLVNNVYNSLENPDKPIKFYEELLDILNILKGGSVNE